MNSRETALLDHVPGSDAAALGDPVVTAEVLQGFRDDRELHVAQSVPDTLDFQPMKMRQPVRQQTESHPCGHRARPMFRRANAADGARREGAPPAWHITMPWPTVGLPPSPLENCSSGSDRDNVATSL